jgi:hypothetical protein
MTVLVLVSTLTCPKKVLRLPDFFFWRYLYVARQKYLMRGLSEYFWPLLPENLNLKNTRILGLKSEGKRSTRVVDKIATCCRKHRPIIAMGLYACSHTKVLNFSGQILQPSTSHKKDLEKILSFAIKISQKKQKELIIFLDSLVQGELYRVGGRMTNITDLNVNKILMSQSLPIIPKEKQTEAIFATKNPSK